MRECYRLCLVSGQLVRKEPLSVHSCVMVVPPREPQIEGKKEIIHQDEMLNDSPDSSKSLSGFPSTSKCLPMPSKSQKLQPKKSAILKLKKVKTSQKKIGSRKADVTPKSLFFFFSNRESPDFFYIIGMLVVFSQCSEDVLVVANFYKNEFRYEDYA